MYSLFKWIINTKKSASKNGYFLLYIPKELLDLLNASELALITENPNLESRVKSHTRNKSQVRVYSKLRKKSSNCIKVIAQNQNVPKALNTTLKFSTIFRQKHISNILFYLPSKSNIWIKYRYEGKKEIYPHNYGLIEKADIKTIGEKDRLITFE